MRPPRDECGDEYLAPPSMEIEEAEERERAGFATLTTKFGLFVAYAGTGGVIFVLLSTNQTDLAWFAGPLILLSFAPMVMGFAYNLRRCGKCWAWAFLALLPPVGYMILTSMVTDYRPRRVLFRGATSYPRFEEQELELASGPVVLLEEH